MHLTQPNAIKSKEKFWVECVDKFSTTLKTMLFSLNDGTRFFVIKMTEEDISKALPFLIEKLIKSVVGNAKSITIKKKKNLRSSNLLIEVQNYSQATNFKKI